jgi:hypothetical protein
VTNQEYAELDIRLRRNGSQDYEVELRFNDPQSASELAPVSGRCEFDCGALNSHDPECGRALAQQLFRDPPVARFFEEARSIAEAGGNPLRLRLTIDNEAAELHGIPWELMQDPSRDGLLSQSERFIFSRFMWSADWRRVELRPKRAMRALIVVASPGNVTDYRLSPIDVEGEIARATKALDGIGTDVLGRQKAASLDNIVDALREDIDILYLVCHGALVSPGRTGADEEAEPVPWLFLEKEGEAGRVVDRVSGATFARRLADIQHLPRLAVLVSCESAGREQSAAAYQSSLAPRLARAGVPAVIAMQDRISVETANRLMPKFFQEVLADGRIDRAMAAARAVVRDRPDFWIPATFLRLRGGRIWYDSGFGDRKDAETRWNGLATAVQKCNFTPIVGWGLAETIYGSKSDLASRIAAAKSVPLSAHMAADLQLVSQYLLVSQCSTDYAVDSIKEQMRTEVYARHRDSLGADFQDAPLSALLREVGRIHRERENDPIRMLAELPAPVIINASPDNILVEALKAAGKTPKVQYALWRKDAVGELEDVRPTVESPLVFHVFGYFGNPESLVVTEDDHFEHLMGLGMNTQLIPRVVKNALVDNSMFFVGFRLTDWTFRVLFRIVRSLLGGSSRQKMRPHVGVQIEPDGSLFTEAEDARKYLKLYCEEAQVPMFWGNCEEFLTELKQHLGPPKVKVQASDDF